MIFQFLDYMLKKSDEENFHVDRMIAFLVDRDQQVELPTVEASERSWPSVKDLFDVVASLQEGVVAMLDGCLEEQLQEKAEAHLVCKRLRLARSSTTEQLLLDQHVLDDTTWRPSREGLDSEQLQRTEKRWCQGC